MEGHYYFRETKRTQNFKQFRSIWPETFCLPPCRIISAGWPSHDFRESNNKGRRRKNICTIYIYRLHEEKRKQSPGRKWMFLYTGPLSEMFRYPHNLPEKLLYYVAKLGSSSLLSNSDSYQSRQIFAFHSSEDFHFPINKFDFFKTGE